MNSAALAARGFSDALGRAGDLVARYGGAVSPVVTMSAGVATTVPEEGRSPTELLAAADAAMYQAKREGRNRVSRA
jgi:two-component system chemotaxis family response regulator WspR